MRRSGYLLGRRPLRERLHQDGTVRVSVVECLPASPKRWLMYVETTKTGRAKRPVLYRINVKLKHKE